MLDSSTQPERRDASTSPAPSPKPQGEAQASNGLPARLTGRHFLGKRETGSACKVCSQLKRKRVEDEEQERKKRKSEEDAEPDKKTEEVAEEEKGVHSHSDADGERKEEGHCETKSNEKKSETSHYCKTCSGEPSLCPVPCFELFHTKLIYKTVPELES